MNADGEKTYHSVEVKDPKASESYFKEGLVSFAKKKPKENRSKYQSHDLNKIRIDSLPDEKGSKKRNKQNRRKDDEDIQDRRSRKKKSDGRAPDEGSIGGIKVHKEKKPKRMTKHEKKLELEQIKENLRAKKEPGYIPRDIFREDKERREREKE